MIVPVAIEYELLWLGLAA